MSEEDIISFTENYKKKITEMNKIFGKLDSKTQKLREEILLKLIEIGEYNSKLYKDTQFQLDSTNKELDSISTKILYYLKKNSI